MSHLTKATITKAIVEALRSDAVLRNVVLAGTMAVEQLNEARFLIGIGDSLFQVTVEQTR